MSDATERRDASPAGAFAPLVDGSAVQGQVAFRRRRFLVHRRYQLRVTAITVSTAFVLLLLLNFTLFTSNQRTTQAAVDVAPELGPYFAAQDRYQIGLMVIGSLAFLGGVFLLGILESHRTAGASFNACRCLGKVRDGEYAVRMRLRRGDNLQEIELAFNEMASALHDKALHDADALDEMAERAERLKVRDAQDLAQELRHLAEAKRLLAG